MIGLAQRGNDERGSNHYRTRSRSNVISDNHYSGVSSMSYLTSLNTTLVLILLLILTVR